MSIRQPIITGTLLNIGTAPFVLPLGVRGESCSKHQIEINNIGLVYGSFRIVGQLTPTSEIIAVGGQGLSSITIPFSTRIIEGSFYSLGVSGDTNTGIGGILLYIKSWKGY